MAGIWDRWTAADGEIIHSFSILTTGPNELMASIHERMPVILSREDERRWLFPLPESELLKMLRPYPAGHMKVYQISKLVNPPGNDGPEVWRDR